MNECMHAYISALQYWYKNRPNPASKNSMIQNNENGDQRSQDQVCGFFYCMGLLLAVEELQNAVVGCAFCPVTNHMPKGESKHKI